MVGPRAIRLGFVLVAAGGVVTAGACGDDTPGTTGPGEHTPAECSNGLDDDGDGATDCLDYGCILLAICDRRDGGSDDGSADGEDGAGDGGGDGGDGDGSAEDVGPDLCGDYVCPPYGSDVGEVLADLRFTPANFEALAMAGDDGVLDLHDVFAQSQTRGGTLRGILFFDASGACGRSSGQAEYMERINQEFRDDGIQVIGMLSVGDTPGVPADVAYAMAYATAHGWTFPAIVGDFPTEYWPGPDIVGHSGFPLILLVDALNMRLYGRYSGAGRLSLLRQTLELLVEGDPDWGPPDWTRRVDFDCNPAVGTETEPNSVGEAPENATALPQIMSGVSCPAVIEDGVIMDAEAIDLGMLSAGQAIDVQMTRVGVNDVYPFFYLARGDPRSGLIRDPTWWAPGIMAGVSAGRQYIIEQSAQYFLILADGRAVAEDFMGESGPVADQHHCCEGGADYWWELGVDRFPLARTEDVVELTGSPPTHVRGTFDEGDLDVYVTDGHWISVAMVEDDPEKLDPYLLLYDPLTGTVITSDDDGGATEEKPNSARVSLPPAYPDARLVWIVAGYDRAWLRGSDPGYDLVIEWEPPPPP
ncbi:MAG: hypothetical protein HY905_11100 [Deltaproteobacteria bacterium]|nr:hypothetical protein [Deltaproteobacteria bacterium]